MEPDLSVSLGNIRLKNPVLLASGTAGYGEEISKYIDLSKIGAIIVKGITVRPTPGNPPPRICETPSGMLNSIGLPNIGVDSFLSHRLPFLKERRATVIVNIFGTTVEEYEEVAYRLDRAQGISALEINISCPNIKKGGIMFGRDIAATREIVKRVRSATELPIFVKLSPAVTDITLFARICEEEGASGLSLINTIPAMAIDIHTWRPKLSTISGGLSGPAIRPIAVKIVWEVYRKVGIPIIGMGGIISVSDAIEFFLAGASAVAVGTGNFIKPDLSLDIIDGLREYLKKKNINNMESLIGALRYE